MCGVAKWLAGSMYAGMYAMLSTTTILYSPAFFLYNMCMHIMCLLAWAWGMACPSGLIAFKGTVVLSERERRRRRLGGRRRKEDFGRYEKEGRQERRHVMNLSLLSEKRQRRKRAYLSTLYAHVYIGKRKACIHGGPVISEENSAL